MIAMQPFTKRLVELLPNQYHSKAIEVDGFLRVQGAPQALSMLSVTPLLFRQIL